jgi:hypothetical protein
MMRADQTAPDAGSAEMSFSPNGWKARQFGDERRVQIPHTRLFDAQVGPLRYHRTGIR